LKFAHRIRGRLVSPTLNLPKMDFGLEFACLERKTLMGLGKNATSPGIMTITTASAGVEACSAPPCCYE
jgi:hypothetical protein